MPVELKLPDPKEFPFPSTKLELQSSACQLLGKAAARIVEFANGKMFLIVGTNRSTKDDLKEFGVVTQDQDGKVRHYDYLVEATVASGSSLNELWLSVLEHRRLQGMTMLEYLLEPTAAKC